MSDYVEKVFKESEMDINVCCPQKVVSAEAAIARIKRGSRVFIGTGCGEPQHLIRAMVKNEQLQDITEKIKAL